MVILLLLLLLLLLTSTQHRKGTAAAAAAVHVRFYYDRDLCFSFYRKLLLHIYIIEDRTAVRAFVCVS